MTITKLIQSRDEEKFIQLLNNAIQNYNFEQIEIKFSTATNGAYVSFSALVIYK